MAANRFLVAWVLALGIVIASILILMNFIPKSNEAHKELHFTHTNSLIIGSSRAAFGFARADKAQQFLTDPNDKYELAYVLAIDAELSVALLERAIDDNVQNIYFETVDFVLNNNRQAFYNIWADQLLNSASIINKIDKLKWVVINSLTQTQPDQKSIQKFVSINGSYGKPFVIFTDMSAQKFIKRDQWHGKTQPRYLHVSTYFNELTSLYKKATENGLKLHFFIPPVSKHEVDNFSWPDYNEFISFTRNTFSSINAPIYIPSTSWENKYFVDPPHVNISGQEKFIAEFKQWLEDQDGQ